MIASLSKIKMKYENRKKVEKVKKMKRLRNERDSKLKSNAQICEKGSVCVCVFCVCVCIESGRKSSVNGLSKLLKRLLHCAKNFLAAN